ncbi:MAG TPA: O-antigen ligase family protein, partial [Amaricoccus sp.]|nr:O-antigen ligase family protein [Amaricoccus sp.]
LRERADPPALLCGLVLLAALAEFGQVWYYPQPDPGLDLTRAFGAAFRTALWVGASATIALHLLRRGPGLALRTLAPFAVFLLWAAAVVGFWSIDRMAGLRALAFWLLAAGLAVAAASELPPRRLAQAVALLFLAVVAGSLVVGLLDPGSGTTAYGDATMLRGLFPHKNAFGWFTALGLVWAVGTRRALGRPLALATAATMATGLAASGSKTAAMMLPAAALYALALRLCLGGLATGARAALGLAIAAALAGLVAALAAPVLIESLGREATLTGRTDVWRHYLAYLHDRPLTGYGTGILSSDTELNRTIGAAVPGHESQRLRSPHSLYIGLASETGLIGLAFFVAAQAWIAFVAPFRRLGPWSRTAGVLAVAILLAGVTEMRDGILPGTATLLLVVARAAAFRDRPRSFA